MMILVWGILSICISIGFIILFFKAAKLVRDKWGMAVAIIFVIGCLSFAGRSGDERKNRNPHKPQEDFWNFTSEDSLNKNNTFLTMVLLEKNPVSKYFLLIKYGTYKNEKSFIPISANTLVNGFESGRTWRPVSMSLEKTSDNNTYEYQVDAVVEWKILGLGVYSQSKNYVGTFLLTGESYGGK